MKKLYLFLLSSACCCLTAAFASPQRGESAAKSLAFADDDSAPTAADYVQSGLVNFWDGIENADWGVHTDGPCTTTTT